MFIANVGEKISTIATIIAIYDNSYDTFFPDGHRRGTRTVMCYAMVDENGNEIQWTTSNILDVEDDSTSVGWYSIKRNDKIKIAGTCKRHKVSGRGVEQTVLTRCKWELLEKGMTEEEEIRVRQEEQLKNLNGKAIKNMSYREYKEKYANCETLYKSFYRDSCGYSFISVII